MKTDTEDKIKTLGEYNAWVERGETKAERNLRLSEVPENLRDQVKRHVITTFKLRKKK